MSVRLPGLRRRGSSARRAQRSAWAGALVLGALCAGPGPSSALAEGARNPAKGKAPKPAPAGAPETLPRGCTRLVGGYGAVMSPDRRFIAYVRGGGSPSMHHAYLLPHQEPIELRVRDPKTDTSWALPFAARPVGWVAGTLLLDAGFGIEPVKGARTENVASLPSDATAIELAWTRDGRKLAWVPVTERAAPTAIRVLAIGMKPVTLAGTAGLRTDQTVFLAWSPDASKLYVNGLFQTEKDHPVRLVALVDATTGVMTPLASMPDWIGIPGLHDGLPAYRDPRIEDPKLVDLEVGRATEPRYAQQVMSGDGRLATWLAGTGWYESDAFVVELATGAVKRVTDDGDAKWSPALDVGGRRLAFLTAAEMESDSIGRGENVRDAQIRVVDLLTGEPTEIALAVNYGVPARLSWTSDGAALVYDVRGVEGEGTFSQSVPAPKPAPAEPTIRSLPYSAKNRIVSWLASDDEGRVQTAVYRAEDAWDPDYLPALRQALATWKDDKGAVVPCLAHLLDLRRATDAIVDLRRAADSKCDTNRIAIFEALLHLGAHDVVDELEWMRKTSVDPALRAHAGLLQVKAGDDRGWPSVAAAARSDDVFLREDVCRALSRIRHAKSIDILISLVADHRPGHLFGSKLESRVAPLAQLALRALTGHSYGEDAAKWSAWWKDEAKGVLPTDVSPVDDPEHAPGR